MMKAATLYLSVLIGLFANNCLSYGAPNDTDKTIIVKDDPILAQLDSLDVMNFFKRNNFTADANKLNIYNYAKDSIPLFNETIYRDRLKKLDNMSPFALDYHEDVRRYIEIYAVKRRGTISKCLGMAELYFPLFEEMLAKHKMPLELKYLAIVESALNPTAKSRAGAMGLWQFMYGTGKLWGLKTNSYVDERCDPVKETEAACLYLKYLYKYYGNDWQLALASYNAGPGNVNKAIRRSGGKKNYWELREYLPRETAGYVPAFIAVNYIMAYHKEHNIYPVKPKYFYYELDSVHIRKKLTFAQISEYLKIPVEDLRILNPIYIMDVIPESEEGYPLFLPKNLIGDFIANEEKIYEYFTTTTEQVTTTQSSTTTTTSPVVNGLKLIEHKVVKGEYLTAIANKYKTEADSLKKWNQLTTETLAIGQVLKVYVPAENNGSNTSVNKENNTTANNQQPVKTGPTYYTIRSGDTLWSLAQKYGTTVDKLREWNNLYNGKSIQVGMKIIVAKG